MTNDGESPNNEDFIDLDDELVDGDDYGDYDEEDDTATTASPNSKKTKQSNNK